MTADGRTIEIPGQFAAVIILIFGIVAAGIVSSTHAGATCNTYYSAFDDYHHHDGSTSGEECNGNTSHSQANSGEDFYMSDGNDTSKGFGEFDNMRMGTGADRAEGGDGADDLHMRADGDWAEGGGGADDILGGWGSDTLIGGARPDNMDDDVSDSYLEKDTLFGQCGGDDIMDTHDGDTNDEINYSIGDTIFRDFSQTEGKDVITQHTC